MAADNGQRSMCDPHMPNARSDSKKIRIRRLKVMDMPCSLTWRVIVLDLPVNLEWADPYQCFNK